MRTPEKADFLVDVDWEQKRDSITFEATPFYEKDWLVPRSPPWASPLKSALERVIVPIPVRNHWPVLYMRGSSEKGVPFSFFLFFPGGVVKGNQQEHHHHHSESLRDPPKSRHVQAHAETVSTTMGTRRGLTSLHGAWPKRLGRENKGNKS